MLCVTGSEASAEALYGRLMAVERRLQGTEFLQEVRLDHLSEPGSVIAGLRPHAGRLVVTCRPTRQRGSFTGSEEARLALLHDAASIGPLYVDLEADCPSSVAASLRGAGAGGVVVSWHLWKNDPEGVRRAVERLVAHEADARKLAVMVDDAADLGPLKRVSELTPGLFVIGMGAPGTLSRCRYPAFGAQWTYVAADSADATAPGQLSLDEALFMGLPAAAGFPFACLLGGSQIVHSPGPGCYNRLFRQKGAPWSYLPVVSTRGLDALSLARDLGAFGASVTMPNKAAALAFATPDPVARRVGAANSVRFGPPPVATNTDVIGIAKPLSRALGGTGHETLEVLVLGAGGAARAALEACRQLGMEARISARRHEAALALVDRDRAVPWSARGEDPSEVLINATSVGGNRSPWPPDTDIGKAIVFDLTLGPGPSTLLAQAEREGAQILDGLEMWIEQGAAQTRFLTGLEVSVDELREALA